MLFFLIRSLQIDPSKKSKKSRDKGTLAIYKRPLAVPRVILYMLQIPTASANYKMQPIPKTNLTVY